MAQQAREASQLPVPDRYYAEYVQLPSGAEEEEEVASLEIILQEALNRGIRQSWKLVSVTKTRRAGRASSSNGTQRGSSPGKALAEQSLVSSSMSKRRSK